MKFASRSGDLASLLVNGLLSYPGIYPNIYIASHVIPGIYAAAVAKCNQFKFKIKENPHGIISNALDGSEDDILYEESDASSENNQEDCFSGSDNDFLGFYDE